MLQKTPPASLLEQLPRIGGWFPPLEGREDDGAAVWHPFHQEVCTLRLLPSTGEQQALMRKMVRRLHRLQHENFVPIHDVLIRDGQVCLLEGDRSGYTLRDSLDEMGALELTEALAVFRQVILAVSTLHQVKLVHGDLRPSNVILDVSAGVLTVRLRGLGPGMLGAPPADARYLSPERISGAPADPRSDIFALGVMFYECLAGRRPFDATEPWALRKLIRTTTPEPLQQLAPGLPMEVAFAVASALKADPAQRFADAASFARAFPDDVVLTSPDAPSLPPVGDEEPEITEVIDVPEPEPAEVDEPELTANALADAVGDIDWEEVRKHADAPAPPPLEDDEKLSDQLGGRSVDALLETSRIVRLLAVPAILATALLLMLTWKDITSARESQIHTAQIHDELSQMMLEVEDLGEEAIDAGVEPNSVRPLIDSYNAAQGDEARRLAAETMTQALLSMLRSLPETDDERVRQDRRHLELRVSRLHNQIQNFRQSTDTFRKRSSEPMGWIVELFQL